MIAPFQCPKSFENLTPSTHHWKSESGSVYPVVDGIPYLVGKPDHLIAEWQTLTQQTLKELRGFAENAAGSLPFCNGELTYKRVQKLSLAYAEQAVLLEKQFQPFIGSTLGAPVSQALQKILPSHQKLLSYSAGIFRDWNWGEEENKKTLELVKEILPRAQGNFLFLNCGSGRFLYDVHETYQPESSIGVDLHPLLLSIAQRMFQGAELSLYEFPLLPISSDKAAVLRKLKAPRKIPGQVQLILADLAALPLREATSDVIFTPWLIDTLGFETKAVIRSIHRLLKPKGVWVQLGPLNFHRRNPADNLCIDELVALTNQNGFQVNSFQMKLLPFHQSPIDSHHRVELISAFSALRDESVFEKQNLKALPDWLENPEKPIPKLQSIEASLFVHRLYAEVLGLVDGTNSIHTIAKVLNTGFQLDTEQALGVTLRFFRSAWEAELWE